MSLYILPPPEIWLPPKPAIIRPHEEQAVFPFPMFSVPVSSAPAASVTYIDKSQGAPTAGVFTYAGASIDTAAGDDLIVGHFRESNAGSSTTSVAFNGSNLSLWSPGAILLSFINNIYLEVFYGTPGAVTGGSLVSTTSGATGINLFPLKIVGSTGTPLDQVSSTSATSTTVALNDVETKVNGGLIAFGAAQLNSVTWTESWSGSETVIEDFDGNSATGNSRLVVCHFLTTSALTTQDLTLTISASQTHIGGAISFGP